MFVLSIDRDFLLEACRQINWLRGDGGLHGELIRAAKAVDVAIHRIIVVGQAVHVFGAFCVYLLVDVVVFEAAIGVVVDELRLSLALKSEVIAVLINDHRGD